MTETEYITRWWSFYKEMQRTGLLAKPIKKKLDDSASEGKVYQLPDDEVSIYSAAIKAEQDFIEHRLNHVL